MTAGDPAPAARYIAQVGSEPDAAGRRRRTRRGCSATRAGARAGAWWDKPSIHDAPGVGSAPAADRARGAGAGNRRLADGKQQRGQRHVGSRRSAEDPDHDRLSTTATRAEGAEQGHSDARLGAAAARRPAQRPRPAAHCAHLPATAAGKGITVAIARLAGRARPRGALEVGHPTHGDRRSAALHRERTDRQHARGTSEARTQARRCGEQRSAQLRCITARGPRRSAARP